MAMVQSGVDYATPMLRLLAWSIFLGLVHVFLAAGLITHQRGLKWNMGNRDGDTPPASGAAARADRASRNFLETFPFFAAALLAALATHRTSAHTVLGGELYFWARLAYLPIYVAGIPYIRTAVFGVSLWGLLQLVEALL